MEEDTRVSISFNTYCKTHSVSVPLNLAFLAFWLLALNITYAKIQKSYGVILLIEYMVSFCACAVNIT